jgi:hypothetical protein
LKDVVVYRLLTMGTVEIDMMKKQISKKKLERLTIHSGDFRKAGKKRVAVSIDELRRLLEDDVKNIHRRESSSVGGEVIIKNERTSIPSVPSTASLASTVFSSDSLDDSSSAVTAVLQKEISEEELELVLDRFLMFSKVDTHLKNSSTSVTSPSAPSSSASKKGKKGSATKSSSSSRSAAQNEFPIEGDMYDVVNMGIDTVLMNLG